MPSVSYALSMLRPTSHLLDVTIDVAGLAGASFELVMPAWTPGSYRIRDYARNVQEFSAGRHSWSRVDKNRWRVRTGGAERARVTYRVYAFEMNARGAHLDADHGYVNGAGAFMYLYGAKERPVTLDVRIPAGWNIATGLSPAGPRRFAAADYDELVDCPIEAGKFELRTWRTRGIEHRLALHGRVNRPLDRVTRDLAKIVEAEAALFGGLPYEHYTFLLHTGPGSYGGLEHRNSTSLEYSSSGFRSREDYDGFLELAAHEYFHLWNVKRIRPSALGPFDYEREVHTTLLWAMEGITSYYDGLFLVRAGLMSPERYFGKTAKRWAAFLEKPGRRIHSLSESSFDAWIKYYQPNEHSPNSTISYYEKGEFAGMALDLEIRRRTRNRRSLDDVLRRLFKRVTADGAGFPEGDYRRACEDVAGGSLAGFWRDYIDGTRELELGGFLEAAGLGLRRDPKKEEGEKPVTRRPHFGAVVQRSGDHLVAATVRSGSPAERAGLCARDEILAIDGTRVDMESWEKRLDALTPGRAVDVAVLRAGALRELSITPESRDATVLKIVPLAKATPLQKQTYRSWLGRPWTPPKKG
ncbi:MAG TPA: PDZ domain-containing protein [Thermoanaerobaculia bacterium]|nr:PDZ domain-containing protein [Thermoanaerobaculia bacterium]